MVTARRWTINRSLASEITKTPSSCAGWRFAFLRLRLFEPPDSRGRLSLRESRLLRRDSHPVERPVHEGDGDQEEAERQDVRQPGAMAAGQRDGQFDRQQSEQRGEFDDRI